MKICHSHHIGSAWQTFSEPASFAAGVINRYYSGGCNKFRGINGLENIGVAHSLGASHKLGARLRHALPENR
jgi:hypothetical protein